MLSNRTQLFVSSHLLLAANACSASLSPQSLTQRPKPTVSMLAHSSPAVRRDAETTAQPRRMDPSFSHQPTPTVHSSRLRRHPTSSLSSTPRRFPSRLRIRCSSPAPHLAPPCYPIYIYTSLVAKSVLFCVAYALVCAGRAVLCVHARDREVDARSPIGEAGSQRTHKKQVCAKLHTLP